MAPISHREIDFGAAGAAFGKSTSTSSTVSLGNIPADAAAYLVPMNAYIRLSGGDPGPHPARARISLRCPITTEVSDDYLAVMVRASTQTDERSRDAIALPAKAAHGSAMDSHSIIRLGGARLVYDHADSLTTSKRWAIYRTGDRPSLEELTAASVSTRLAGRQLRDVSGALEVTSGDCWIGHPRTLTPLRDEFGTDASTLTYCCFTEPKGLFKLSEFHVGQADASLTSDFGRKVGPLASGYMLGYPPKTGTYLAVGHWSGNALVPLPWADDNMAYVPLARQSLDLRTLEERRVTRDQVVELVATAIRDRKIAGDTSLDDAVTMLASDDPMSAAQPFLTLLDSLDPDVVASKMNFTNISNTTTSFPVSETAAFLHFTVTLVYVKKGRVYSPFTENGFVGDPTSGS